MNVDAALDSLRRALLSPLRPILALSISQQGGLAGMLPPGSVLLFQPPVLVLQFFRKAFL